MNTRLLPWIHVIDPDETEAGKALERAEMRLATKIDRQAQHGLPIDRFGEAHLEFGYELLELRCDTFILARDVWEQTDHRRTYTCDRCGQSMNFCMNGWDDEYQHLCGPCWEYLIEARRRAIPVRTRVWEWLLYVPRRWVGNHLIRAGYWVRGYSERVQEDY